MASPGPSPCKHPHRRRRDPCVRTCRRRALSRSRETTTGTAPDSGTNPGSDLGLFRVRRTPARDIVKSTQQIRVPSEVQMDEERRGADAVDDTGSARVSRSAHDEAEEPHTERSVASRIASATPAASAARRGACSPVASTRRSTGCASSAPSPRGDCEHLTMVTCVRCGRTYAQRVADAGGL